MNGSPCRAIFSREKLEMKRCRVTYFKVLDASQGDITARCYDANYEATGDVLLKRGALLPKNSVYIVFGNKLNQRVRLEIGIEELSAEVAES